MSTVDTEQQRWMIAVRHAARIAADVWQAIEPLYHGSYLIHEKEDGPATEADRLADRLILEGLKEHYPVDQYGYLSEESIDSDDRLGCDRVWIIDPIDGTKEFIRHNGQFAVHIALAERLADGEFHPVAAVVYRPIDDTVFWAVRGAGAWQGLPGSVTGQPARRLLVSRRNDIARLRSVVSNTHATSRLMRLIDSLKIEDHWKLGSLGLKACAIAGGEAELYIVTGLGKVKEWDVCAPHLVLSEAGGVMTDLWGQPIAYNRQDPRLEAGLLASNGPVHDQLVERISDFMETEGVAPAG